MSAFAFLGSVAHPEVLLKGTWKEISWTYDRVDLPQSTDSTVDGFLEEQIKSEITKDLIIHKSETWTFDERANLFLTKEGNQNETLNWRLKGRGHILKLLHSDGVHEFYQIKELTDDKMVLHFENDMHARGIVRIEFEKLRD